MTVERLTCRLELDRAAAALSAANRLTATQPSHPRAARTAIAHFWPLLCSHQPYRSIVGRRC